MSLQEVLRERSQSLRKHVQENESLEFRNQQLSKRVVMLQEEISSPGKKKKKVCTSTVHSLYPTPRHFSCPVKIGFATSSLS